MNPLVWNIGSINRASSYCHKERKGCVWWVEKYLKDCLCNVTDEISFGFGLISLVAWGVAEIPQIVTNFRTKSSHGVSTLFLLTWVAGDIFNLVGCLLEPATLPTQYYTAVLYTASTVLLLLQSLYYDHLYSQWGRQRKHSKTTALHDDEQDEHKRPLNPKDKDTQDEDEDGGGGIPIPTSARPRRRDVYYITSARSLAGSSTPPFRSYLGRAANSGPSALALAHENHSSSEDEAEADPAPAARPISIPRSAARGVMMLVAASLSSPIHSDAMAAVYMGRRPTARKLLLQDGHDQHSALGQWLGWLMAVIYMGGRFPQIIMNIKRGSVEGLNPLMFVFALIANVSYVASILVRSAEWNKIKANMPWLLDAVVCVALDLFIILQYVYYKYMPKEESSDYQNGNYMEAEPKPA